MNSNNNVTVNNNKQSTISLINQNNLINQQEMSLKLKSDEAILENKDLTSINKLQKDKNSFESHKQQNQRNVKLNFKTIPSVPNQNNSANNIECKNYINKKI